MQPTNSAQELSFHTLPKNPKKNSKKSTCCHSIKGKVLITPDLTTLFGAKAEDLAETFSILTRVFDGRGLKIDSGVYGISGYEGDYMFSWIGATTPIPHKVWDLFGNLGARMYFMQIMNVRPHKPRLHKSPERKELPH